MRAGAYLIVFWTIVWVAMAVPTAAFARRLGDPLWISYLVWFPHWVPLARPTLFAAVPFLAEQHATAFITWVMYLVPGVVLPVGARHPFSRFRSAKTRRRTSGLNWRGVRRVARNPGAIGSDCLTIIAILTNVSPTVRLCAGYPCGKLKTGRAVLKNDQTAAGRTTIVIVFLRPVIMP